MEEKDILTEEFPFDPESDEEIERREAERRAEEEAKIAPYKAASAQRKESAAIVAEHDELLSDILFEMTMNELAE